MPGGVAGGNWRDWAGGVAGVAVAWTRECSRIQQNAKADAVAKAITDSFPESVQSDRRTNTRTLVIVVADRR